MARGVHPDQIEQCRERPPCGGAVIDRREHRRWHERVYIAEDTTASTRSGPRFIGEPDPEDAAEAGR